MCRGGERQRVLGEICECMQDVMYAYGYHCGINSATWYLGLVATFFVDACKPAHMEDQAKHGLKMRIYNNETYVHSE